MDIIREDFFHFLWENLHFSQNPLITTTGESLNVVHPGYHNSGDGPDYRFAKIRLGSILLHGDVELHKTASEWEHHGHHRDSRYERVILHVVVKDDLHKRNVTASDGHAIPTMELRSALPSSLARLWRAYHRPADMPCSGLVSEIPGDLFQEIVEAWDTGYFNHRLDRMLSLYPSGKPMKTAWQQMLIRGVFQGLGYHKNQTNMLHLADAIFISTNRNSKARTENRGNTGIDNGVQILRTKRKLLEMAGLEPEKKTDVINGKPKSEKRGLKTKKYESNKVDRLENDEYPEITQGLGVLFKRTDWDFSASRPPNQPPARISQAAELFVKLNRIPVTSWLHHPASELWNRICQLENTPAIGKNRKEIIFHNIILPSVYLLGRWLRKKNICQDVRTKWGKQHIPLPETIKKRLTGSNFPAGEHYFKLATLHHFKYFCRSRRCGECAVMKYFVQA